MPSTPAVLARLFGVAVVLLATVAVAHPAHAHTDFDYSVPTDGASVGAPLAEVTVAFTLPVTLIGSGFEVFDPQGNVLQPFAVTDDDTIFRLQFDPPLAGGAVRVRYTVTAEDGHSLSGSFSFTVSVPLPASTDPAPVTTLLGTAPSRAPPATSAASSEIAELVVGAGTPSSGPAGDTGDQSN
ncbi:MAG TPA: copper resistance CopC family protein, partial [Ilumatobacter sp.]|nr:copper resistance CopC family protein [Ilumatobacter sp.]